MSEIMAIASGTWKNILRMKVVYFLILCVWILIGSAALYEVLSMGQHKPLMIDVSLALNAVAAALEAVENAGLKVAAALVVISITFEIPRELRQGVASTLLTKSLGRTQYLAGKLIGIAFAAIVICALITFGSFVIFSYTFSESIALPMFQAQLLQILSIIPMAAIGVFFATLFPEVVAPVLTIIAIWFSYSVGVLQKVPLLYGGILPNLDLFNFRAQAVYHADIPWSYVGLVTLWGIAFAIFALMLTSLFFKVKDIK